MHQRRFSDGSRRTTHIAEVLPQEGELPRLKDVFRFRESGLDSEGRVTGEHVYLEGELTCQHRLERVGLDLSTLSVS